VRRQAGLAYLVFHGRGDGGGPGLGLKGLPELVDQAGVRQGPVAARRGQSVALHQRIEVVLLVFRKQLARQLHRAQGVGLEA